VLRRLGDFYAFILGWPALARLHKGLFYISARALGLYNYQSAALSGENWISRRLLDRPAPVVFDVGANCGDWLADARRVNAHSIIHAFEPQASLAAQIAASYPEVRINNVAVGDAPGFLDLFDYADHPGSQHASLVSGVIDQMHGRTARHTKVPVVTLDDYCAEHGVGRIDFLKVDVEGFELQVLHGSRRMLSEGRIQALQFEVTHLNVLSRVFVADFAKCLGSDYSLHRLLPHGLMALQAKDPWFNEQFGYQNIVALRKVGAQ
jgi:FkbM family methyltransferase